ncbi:hypothetical protein VP01_1725g3 [Puccinia sorghi]|uniref:Uncharacterized protein n=1 Tax=Puccinia sorghi TaxID=27349 RepID=A0A0L6VFB1_9BASI|nr:hypothetical protein VP01_1725g3 [Puccinia sorghi]
MTTRVLLKKQKEKGMKEMLWAQTQGLLGTSGMPLTLVLHFCNLKTGNPGAINTPALLLRSGVHQNRAFGEGLHCHLVVAVMFHLC